MPSVRWGIAGPGRIAQLVAPDFAHVPNAELVAVGSRHAPAPRPSPRSTVCARAYGSYAELVADPERRRGLHRDAAPTAPRDRAGGPRRGQSGAGREGVHGTLAGAQEIGSRRAREARVRHGGDVDALPAGGRPRCASCGRRARSASSARSRPSSASRASSIPPTGCSLPSWAAARCSTSASTSSRSRRWCSARRGRSASVGSLSPTASRRRRRCCSASRTAAARR